jgi:ring-1,2-phenylacetyl-CoA epoxidase subunit PaaC
MSNSKWVLGHWYIKLIQNGRSLTDFNALAAMAQDQLGHTRSLFALLEARGNSGERLEFGRDRAEVQSMELLDEPPTSWADFLVTTSLAEYALRTLFGAHAGSCDHA